MKLGISGSKGGGGNAKASASSPARQAVAGISATMERQHRSACMQIVGDSTGTDPDEWFGIMAQQLAADHDYDVLWRAWDDASQAYLVPTALVGAGDRAVNLSASGQMRFPSSAAYQGDQDVRVKATHASWRAGAAMRVIASRYNASSANRNWIFYLDATGHLCWTWSAAGTADTGTAVSTDIVPFTNGTGWVRVAFDVDNGATGNTATFYTSPDGTTWTQLGAPVVTAGVTTVGPAAQTQDFYIGARNAVASDFFGGSIHWITYAPGSTLATSVVPPLPDHWERNTTSTSVSWTGKPVLLVVNGSASGQALAYHDNATRRPIILQQQGQQAVFVSTSHNEGNNSQSAWIATLNTYVTNVKAALPRVPIVLVAQNPATAPLDAQNIEVRAARGAGLMTYAASQAGVYAVDAWPAFSGDLSTLVEPSDGVHPTQGNGGTSGSDVWGAAIYQELFA